MSQVLAISEIKKILPNSYPKLLIDRVSIISDTECVGVKNISFNEELFQGHFPGHAIMPGVIQIEAMKQTAEIIASKTLNTFNDKNIYIKGLRKVKFRKPNNPGDRMLIEVEVTEISEEEATVKATVKNNLGVSCQAIIILGVREKSEPTEMPSIFNEFDKDENIAWDVEKIKEVIPHRFPFLFLDYLKKAEPTHIIAIKNLTYNEPFFRGQTSDFPTLPECIQSEIVAQTGCCQLLSQECNKGKIGYFMGIDKADFFAPAFPGDQLVIDVNGKAGSSKFGKCKGTIKVDGKLIAEISMTFAIVDA